MLSPILKIQLIVTILLTGSGLELQMYNKVVINLNTCTCSTVVSIFVYKGVSFLPILGDIT